ncbi:MAG: DUF896 domain-containing protein [Clostridia bacterium]|nr:DUF896 domain-containing protein [Clostridia bacterium]
MEKEKILRINYLAAKKKREGLSQSEQEEQKTLYKEYLGAVRRNFKATLDSIEITDKK